jgi:beta-phosphoglucomutase
MLKYLKEKNQAIALGSASKMQDHLGETGIIHYFDVIVDGNDVSNAKPDPEVFLIAAIGAKPEDAIVLKTLLLEYRRPISEK